MILFRSEPNNNHDGPGGNLYTIHPDDTNMHQLTNYDSSTLVLNSSFSPDGTDIVFSKSGAPGAPDIFTMNTDGTNAEARARGSEEFPGYGLRH